MKAYAEKLKDPLWQKKRLEVLARDEWRCVECRETTKTLHVHHLDYEPNTEPWEYPDWYYQTLCIDCHQRYEARKRENERSLVSLFRLRFTNELERSSLLNLLTYQEMVNVSWIISRLGVPRAEAILTEFFWAHLDEALGEPSPTPSCCPACGNEQMISYEQYNSSKCTLCGYIHYYGENTLDKT